MNVIRGRLFAALCLIALIALLSGERFAAAQSAPVTITLLHHADYHAQPLPHFSEGKFDQGGLARAIGYIQSVKRANPNTLSLSGGDTLLPANLWSDEYRGAEWAWFNRGVIDVMAFGNHELDYGPSVFGQRAAEADYPIIASNFINKTTGRAFLLHQGKDYVVKTVGGVKIGLFALADKTYRTLVPARLLPPDVEFLDPIPVGRQVVQRLRQEEKVDLVVFIGHQAIEDDEQMAQAIPSIDVIFGSHSHLKVGAKRLGGPNGPIFISPFQYLTYISRLDLTVQNGKITAFKGELVPMNTASPTDRAIEAKVNEMWGALQAKFPDRFVVIGRAAVNLDYEGINDGETVLGNLVSDIMRDAAQANFFVSTSSSFRGSIPPGEITINDVRNALPFNNTIVTSELTGAQVRQLVDYAITRRGSDFFSQVSGLRFQIVNGKSANLQIQTNPANPASFEPVNDAKTYLAATTNYQAGIAAGYKEIFQAGQNVTDTKRDINTTLIDFIKSRPSVDAKLDQRIVVQAAPAAARPGPVTQLPRTGEPNDPPIALLLGVAALLIIGGVAWRRYLTHQAR